eukprot:g51833.t1
MARNRKMIEEEIELYVREHGKEQEDDNALPKTGGRCHETMFRPNSNPLKISPCNGQSAEILNYCRVCESA